MRVKNLKWIPSTVNFSDMAEGQENNIQDESGESKLYDDIDKEILLLKVISNLTSDKERCVLVLEILREYGYQIDYKSIAHALHIELRWLMRVKSRMKAKVKDITTNV